MMQSFITGRNPKKGRLLYNCKSNFLKMLCQ